MLLATRRDTRKGVPHLRVGQSAFSEQLKTRLQRVGSPARWIQGENEWDFPLTPAAIIALDGVAKDTSEQIQWQPGLREFAEQHLAQARVEHETRLAIERIIRDDTIPIEPYPCIQVDPYTGETCPPMRFQGIAYHWAQRVGGLLLAHDPGCGKTRSATDAAGGWYRNGLIKAMTPTFIDGKPGVDGGVLVVAPKTMLKTWQFELAKWQNATGLIIIGSAERKARLAATPAHFHITNFESLRHVEHNRYAGIIIDECFVAGTLVQTPKGQVPIEAINIGDVVLSYNHETGSVKERRVTEAFCHKAISAVVRVRTEKGEFTCTEGHLFYTKNGYTPAGALYQGQEVMVYGESDANAGITSSSERGGSERQTCLSRVRNFIHPTQQIPPISDMQRTLPCYPVWSEAGEMESSICVGANEEIQPDVETRNSGESDPYTENFLPPLGAPYSRRERVRPDDSGSPVTSGLEACVQRVGIQPHCVYETGPSFVQGSESLQSGYRESGDKGSHRGGRPIAQQSDEEGTGWAKNRVATWAKVESVSVQERRYAFGCSWRGSLDSRTTVYTIEVEEDNNFFVGDVPHLVHNCHRCANHTNQTMSTLAIAQRAVKRLGLSGTPMANNLESIFYPMLILDGGRTLGASKTAFLEKYFEEEVGHGGFVKHTPREDALRSISAAMAESTYVVKKEEALPYLPKKTHTPIYLDMTDEQRKYYKTLKDEALLYIQDATVTLEMAQAKMMKLLQLSQGFVLTDDGTGRHFSDAKTQALMEMLTDTLSQRKVIVWAYFQYEIKRIAALLREAGIPHVRADGTVTSQRDRDADVDRWNRDPEVRVFLRQVSMSEGVTLLSKDCEVPCYDCVYMGLSYSYTSWLQSQDRIHRIGQKYPCNYTYLLTDCGVDRKVFDSVLDKSRLAAELKQESKDHFLKFLT